MKCIICETNHKSLHYHTLFHDLVGWMTEARQDKRPLYKKIFWWKAHITPLITVVIVVIVWFILNKIF